MSLGSIALAEGFTSHLAQHGEEVTFRGAAVTAIVNRGGAAISLNSSIEMQMPAGATIWLPISVDQPTTADVITDAFGVEHAVRSVRRFVLFWSCQCDTNE